MTPLEELNYNIEILKDENNALKEKLENANSQLEDLKKETENDKSLILLLQDQLLSYGIEPFEL
jgi:FtsZ-binding cell division protein ZapB